MKTIKKMAPKNDNQQREDLYNTDIENVGKMPKDEFKKQIQDWMESQQPKLQSKLRKDLIENFTKTSLGRQITTSFQSKQGLVLSPLTLVLNTLVSEFLHSQDYHYTLCVFATEVVFPHTLPDFSKKNFSFTQKELYEIFEAIGLLHFDSITSSIVNAYDDTELSKGNNSLLFAVIKTLIDHMKHVNDEKIDKQVQAQTSTSSFGPTPKGPPPKKPPRHQRQSSDSDEVNINVNNLKVLNRTIEKLSKSVKNMAKHYMEMESSRISNKSHQCNNSKNELEREEKHYYNLMRHIQSISQKLDKCVVNFAALEEKLCTKKIDKDAYENMRYKDWLEAMRDSKNGKRYIDKFQRSIARLWEAERTKLNKYFEDKLNVERKVMKFRYREELKEVNYWFKPFL